MLYQNHYYFIVFLLYMVLYNIDLGHNIQFPLTGSKHLLSASQIQNHQSSTTRRRKQDISQKRQKKSANWTYSGNKSAHSPKSSLV
mmetsp:Transcript_33775/g.38465  ORF Transcript_33775/g.38465 Transcript_33775/m.38465 type:complete len:86 (-) Transcript_33775:116-373(-)